VKLVRTGKVLVRPNNDPKSAFQREIAALLSEGNEEVAFGVCVGLALITCERVEVLWEKATTTHALI
jgi:hypothetical protein